MAKAKLTSNFLGMVPSPSTLLLGRLELSLMQLRLQASTRLRMPYLAE
jgi:hypothetical protein